MSGENPPNKYPYPELFVDLGTRLVACPQWRWRRGMSSVTRALCLGIIEVVGGREDLLWSRNGGTEATAVRPRSELCLPDLTDPATLGCLESMVEGFRALKVNNRGLWWVVYKDGDRVSATKRYGSKGEALGRALLRQWQPTTTEERR